MKHIFKYFLGFLVLGVVACKKDQPEVEYSPIFPISGEWHTHVFNEDGTNVSTINPATAKSFSLSVAALSTYNTANNDTDIAWMRFSTVAYPFGILTKVNVDVPSVTIKSGEYVNTLPVTNKSINLIEAKILKEASKQPSGVVADSIVVKYKTGVDGKTYLIKGHRRTQWPEDQR
ncbi:lipid-binding protein [Sphingobacterium sp.]|uniref:lipid-binding protein n=1 Tax=Sphingobacterium sp. TaxID=341027 RepID=UPI001AE52611|nr:lipid-binding protein [Sphingobacterium sp.]